MLICPEVVIEFTEGMSGVQLTSFGEQLPICESWMLFYPLRQNLMLLVTVRTAWKEGQVGCLLDTWGCVWVVYCCVTNRTQISQLTGNQWSSHMVGEGLWGGSGTEAQLSRAVVVLVL